MSDEKFFRAEIESFLSKETELADAGRYAEWEALVDDDMVYWVPTLEGQKFPPGEKVSIIFDHRARLRTRIAQLQTGKRHSQWPPSPMIRQQTNIQINDNGDETYKVTCNQVVFEQRAQSTREIVTWPGHVEYGLRRGAAGLKMYWKAVRLILPPEAVPSLAFII